MGVEQAPSGSMAGKVALVTGAGKGLGRAYALCLARNGARVLVNNRVRKGKPNSADSVVEEIRSSGGAAEADYCGVENESAGQDLVEHALDCFGRLDIVVANAGLDHPRSFHRQDWTEFEHIFRVNYFGTARLLHAAWPLLREVSGARAVVSVSSAGLYGNHGQAAYSSSKAALLGLVRALAIECANRDLRINALAPYAVTPLTLPWFPREDAERFSPEAAAEVLAWLVSDACQINGRTLIAGGGGVRLAEVRETATLSLDSEVSDTVAALSGLALDRAPESANEEFQDFAASLRADEEGT